MKTFYITGVNGFVGGALTIFSLIVIYALFSSIVFFRERAF